MVAAGRICEGVFGVMMCGFVSPWLRIQPVRFTEKRLPPPPHSRVPYLIPVVPVPHERLDESETSRTLLACLKGSTVPVAALEEDAAI